jgi:hypothetical protein
MASPMGMIRYLRRMVGRVIHFARDVEEDTEALYGPNPNNITSEQKMRSMGPGGGGPGVW